MSDESKDYKYGQVSYRIEDDQFERLEKMVEIVKARSANPKFVTRTRLMLELGGFDSFGFTTLAEREYIRGERKILPDLSDYFQELTRAFAGLSNETQGYILQQIDDIVQDALEALPTSSTAGRKRDKVANGDH